MIDAAHAPGLQGTVALVTGAGDGIGRASAQLLAARGAAVAVLDIDGAAADASASAIADAGGQALALTADVTDDGALAAAVGEVVSAYGALHAAICSAGIWLPDDGLITELPLEVWHRTLAVNLTGTFLTVRNSLPAIVAAGGGSVVCIGSPVAERPDPVFDAYTTVKGAIPALVRAVAQSYGRHGVRANAVLPGAVATGMTRESLEDAGTREAVIAHTPLGRIGVPEDVAAGVAYLVSSDAAFVTGATLAIDGGWLIAP